MASAGLIFTTHTPVPAGHDYFPPGSAGSLLRRLYSPAGIDSRGVPRAGPPEPASDQDEDFCMTVLALRLASASNGVSKLHGKVSREHVESHLAGRAGGRDPHRTRHQRRPLPLLDFVRDEPALRPLSRAEVARGARRSPVCGGASRAFPPRSCGAPTSGAASGWWPSPGAACARSLQRRGAPQSEIDAADEVLDPDALTIGFARRFATYKRATLLLRDLDRLAADSQPPGPAGADHLRRQGASARRCRQGADPADRQARPAAGVPPPHGLPGRLRHDRGPLPGAGRRTSG